MEQVDDDEHADDADEKLAVRFAKRGEVLERLDARDAREEDAEDRADELWRSEAGQKALNADISQYCSDGRTQS